MTEINERLLADFDVYARGITNAKHKMTPAMWPNSYKFFEEGWKAGYVAISQVKEIEVNKFDWQGFIIAAAVGALIGNIAAEILIYF